MHWFIMVSIIYTFLKKFSTICTHDNTEIQNHIFFVLYLELDYNNDITRTCQKQQQPPVSS